MAVEQGIDANTIATVVSSLVTPSVVVWLLVTGKLARGAELEKSQEREAALSKVMTEEVVPALVRVTDALNNATAEETIRRRQ